MGEFKFSSLKSSCALCRQHTQHTHTHTLPCMHTAGTQCTDGLSVYCVCVCVCPYMVTPISLPPLWEAQQDNNPLTLAYYTPPTRGRFDGHNVKSVSGHTDRALRLVDYRLIIIASGTSQRPTPCSRAIIKYKLWSLRLFGLVETQ